MHKSPRFNIRDVDTRWMRWLKKCSRRQGSSGSSLLVEYTSAQKDPWYRSMREMCSTKIDDWPFCCGTLTSDEIKHARERYVEKYPLVAGQFATKPFVDALLAVDESQLMQRSDNIVRARCTTCEDNQRTINRLLTALSAREIVTNDDIQLAAVVAIFQRYFLLGESYSCSRNQVRLKIEDVLQKEISPHERLSAQSTVWRRFVSESLGGEIHGVRSLPCRPRITPISQAQYDEEHRADAKDPE